MLSDHAAQNLRTTSIGLSIWLLLWSSFGEGRMCGFSVSQHMHGCRKDRFCGAAVARITVIR
jgi:hypothetical protein